MISCGQFKKWLSEYSYILRAPTNNSLQFIILWKISRKRVKTSLSSNTKSYFHVFSKLFNIDGDSYVHTMNEWKFFLINKVIYIIAGKKY